MYAPDFSLCSNTPLCAAPLPQLPLCYLWQWELVNDGEHMWRHKCPVLMLFLGLAVLYPNLNVTTSEVRDSACWEKQRVPWPRAVRKEVLVAQSWLTLCDPMGYSPPGPSVRGILQARILQWVAISFSRGSSRPRDRTEDSCIAGRFLIIWGTREVLEQWRPLFKYSKVPQASRKTEFWVNTALGLDLSLGHLKQRLLIPGYCVDQIAECGRKSAGFSWILALSLFLPQACVFPPPFQWSQVSLSMVPSVSREASHAQQPKRRPSATQSEQTEE